MLTAKKKIITKKQKSVIGILPTLYQHTQWSGLHNQTVLILSCIKVLTKLGKQVCNSPAKAINSAK